MKLRQKSKRDQALDAVASVAKTWSEWRLGEKVTKTASKASKKTSKSAEKAAKQAKKRAANASVPDAAKRTPVKIAGIVAVVGGIGAAVAKKLIGGKAEPLYTPPGPAPDMAEPPPSPVAVEDLKDDQPAPDMPPVPSTNEPAATASKETPPLDPTPVVVDDLAGEDAPADADADAPAEADEPELADEPVAVEEPEADAKPAPAASDDDGDDYETVKG